eukprot:6027128-Pyramimonas_sp.AAC.1
MGPRRRPGGRAAHVRAPRKPVVPATTFNPVALLLLQRSRRQQQKRREKQRVEPREADPRGAD